MDYSTSGFPVLNCLLEFAQTHVHWVSDANQPSHPLSPLLFIPLIFPSIRVFSNELLLCIRWPKYWSFSFSTSPSNEYLGLISFRVDWFDFLAVQGTLKSLLQHHSSKASVLWCWRTLGSPLDCKEIKPVNPKGNQPWIFMGRTNDKTEAPILWPADSLEKTLMLGKIEGKRRRGW